MKLGLTLYLKLNIFFSSVTVFLMRIFFLLQIFLLDLGFLPIDNNSATKQQILLASKTKFINYLVILFVIYYLHYNMKQYINCAMEEKSLFLCCSN